jgi:hypothetical protein
MASHSVVIAEPVRTAIRALGGSLENGPAPDLGAVVANDSGTIAGQNAAKCDKVSRKYDKV